MIQTTIYDALEGGAEPEEEQIKFTITHKTTFEERTVIWVGNAPGFILADWMMGGELKFRAGNGQGVGVVRDWVITKGELGKLRNKVGL